MSKNISLAAAISGALQAHPDCNMFYITTDNSVFIKNTLAVAHAVTLSPGNPEVDEFDRKMATDFLDSVVTIAAQKVVPEISGAPATPEAITETPTAPAAEKEAIPQPVVTPAPTKAAVAKKKK